MKPFPDLSALWRDRDNGFARMAAVMDRYHPTAEDEAAEAALSAELRAGTVWQRLIRMEDDYSDCIEAWKVSEAARDRLRRSVADAVAWAVPAPTRAQVRNRWDELALTDSASGEVGIEAMPPPPRAVELVATLTASPHAPTLPGVMLAAA